MYQHLRGQIQDLTPASLTLEAGGVGYAVHIPLSTFRSLQGRTSALLYVHLHVREDDWRLYGFATVDERDFFRMLLGVNGIGPALALSVLCAWTPEEVGRAIREGDTRMLQATKGVGRKLAERLVVELRDKLGGPAAAPTDGPPARWGVRLEQERLPAAAGTAYEALLSLGFERSAAFSRVRQALETAAAGKGDVDDREPESIVKWCLRTS